MTGKSNQRYLGDGVYASFDGYQVWLAVGDHTNTVIALEPPVLALLQEYYLEMTKSLTHEESDHV